MKRRKAKVIFSCPKCQSFAPKLEKSYQEVYGRIMIPKFFCDRCGAEMVTKQQPIDRKK